MIVGCGIFTPMKTQFVAIFILCLSVFGMAQFAHAFECNPVGGQAELTVCASEYFQKQDAELNRLYKEQMTKLETSESKDSFKKAQQIWIKFRDASCLYEAGPSDRQGSIWPMLKLRCMSAITEERISHFKRYVSCTDNLCPR